MVALVLLMFTEFSFTRYGSTYDAFNYIGHIYKILAYSIFYKALYISNVTTPFREMKKAKDKLKDYSDNLNMIVHQRTEELEDINKILLNDLDYAKEMQRCFLPEQLPKDMSVTFHAEYLAADSLSGDFYNVVKLDENNIAIYIGDVSGHGVSAAMLTVFAYQNIIHLKRLKQDGVTGKEFIKPAMVLGNIYDSFNKTNINDEKYIVMLYGIYNIKNKTFEYASAGINVPPYIIKKSGEILEIDARGFPICKFGDFFSPSYENRSIQLETGDKLLFYSDGLVDAKNKQGEIFGHNKLIDILKTNISLSSKAMNIAIKGNFYNHIVHVSDLMDDVTFLTMSVEK